MTTVPSHTFAPIVSTEWLAQHLSDPHVRIVDIRGEVLPAGSPPPRYRAKRDEYDKAHIPGAVFVDWTRDIVDLDNPIPVQVAPPTRFAEAMASRGIGDGTKVVVYDDYRHVFAARLAWALRYYGHDDVAVLDGGYGKWVAEGRPVTSEVPATASGAMFTPRVRPKLRWTADDVAKASSQGALLIDARAPEQYEGRVSAAKRAGHIPGARNVPYPKLVDPTTGTLLPPDQLRRVFAEAGIDVDRLPADVGVYCNGGITCNLPRLALELLGRSEVAVYDGSWNEWGNDPSRPVTTTPEGR